MSYLDTIKLGFGNNLLLGNSSDKLALDALSKRWAELPMSEESLESFGLFDANTANYNTYFPDVTEEDLKPKEGEFIQPVFRALSEVIVHKNWNPVDFGMGSTLKKSMKLLMGQTVNADHETAIGNALGAVNQVSWQDSYKTDKGLLVPAGINAKLKIDGKSHPRIARAILMDPPAIHSTSVTVEFLWDKSHTDMSQEDFFSKLGSLDKDGKLIRRIATQIRNYHEISLVSHGADPYAQKTNENGAIVNPTYADISYNSATAAEKQASKSFFFNFKSDVIKNSIPIESNNNSHQQNNNEVMNKTLLITLAALLAVKFADPENPTDAEVTDLQNKVVGQLNEVTQLQAAQTTSEAEITRLKDVETKYNALLGTAGNVTALQKFMDDNTAALRSKVTAAYATLAAGAPNQAITDMITNASYEVLKGLDIQYTTQLEEKFPISCSKCGSTAVNRASHKKPGAGEENAHLDPHEKMQAYLDSKKPKIAEQIHGKI